MQLPFAKVSVIGLGYIGLPTAAMLANRGVEVIGVDVNERIVRLLNEGKVQIVELDLDIAVQGAVMTGIDFMTIAKWVGHRDGGVLIGKVYGDIADEHRKRMASRMTPIDSWSSSSRRPTSLARCSRFFWSGSFFGTSTGGSSTSTSQ